MWPTHSPLITDSPPTLQVPDIKIGERIRIPMGWLSGYLAMLVGMGITICVQSSSITTSALTPLVGIGVLKVERMYPTVLGANIGTCITGVLAALAADASKLAYTLQAPCQTYCTNLPYSPTVVLTYRTNLPYSPTVLTYRTNLPSY